MAEEGKIIDLPIIAVSAFVASQEIDRCLNSGMSDYSKKEAFFLILFYSFKAI